MIKASRHFLTHKNSNIWLSNLASPEQSTRPLTHEHSQDMKLWTLMILRLSPLSTCPMSHQASILGLRSWYVNSVKMFHSSILWNICFYLTPYFGPNSHLGHNYHVTSHLTVISQEISNYNILQATIPTIKDTQLKKRKYNSTLIIKSPHKDKPKNWQKSCPFLHLQNCQKDPSCPVSRCSPFPPYVLLAATWSTGSPGGDCLRWDGDCCIQCWGNKISTFLQSASQNKTKQGQLLRYQQEMKTICAKLTLDI